MAKKNPPDLTTRNLRAAKRRLAVLTARVAEVEQAIKALRPRGRTKADDWVRRLLLKEWSRS